MDRQHRRMALGRGLSNLIPMDSAERGSNNDIVLVDVDVITGNPFQPRVDSDDEELEGLAKSIEAQGLLQPIILRKKVGGYEVVSGERRLRALKKLNWDRIPCIVRPKVSDREMVEVALVENIQRRNLNEVETANAYRKLLLECNLSHEELSKRVGKSRSAITNTLRLLNLPSAIQQMVRDGSLSMGHARALLSIDNPQRQEALARKVTDEDLSVREVEEAIRKNRGAGRKSRRELRGPPSLKLSGDADVLRRTEQLRYHFGTAVKIVCTTGWRGKIEIEFHDAQDLTRILDLMLVGD